MPTPAHKPGPGREKLAREMERREHDRAAYTRPTRRNARDGAGPAMRRPRPTFGPNVAGRGPAPGSGGTGPKTAAIAPPAAGIALNRLGFGPRPGDQAVFEALGSTHAERLSAYLDFQLDPATVDDSAAEARIAASGYTTLGKSLDELWADHAIPEGSWSNRIRPATETTLATFLRAVYSERQLFEVLVGFWHDHFSIYAWEFYEAPSWVHYDRDILRAHALGNFRALLEAVAKSTPMLFYLDNWLSSVDGPNENYPREMMELHTLGDEVYYGAVPRNQVPTDPSGLQLGFCDEDVFAVTRALTGWSIDADPWWDPRSGNGGYFYRHDWHDTDAKNVLGVQLPAGQGPERDGLDVLDIVATHPATARHIAKKLARRLIGDFPPASVVDAAAQTFLAHTAAPDQIARVVRTIVEAPEFLATWGQKVKRPFEMVVSALRAGGADFPFVEDDSDSDTFDWMFYNNGHYPFAWHPPNGYPDVSEAWVSSGPRVLSWKLVNWLVWVKDDLDVLRLDAYAQTPPGVRSANALADFWIDRVLGRPMSAADRQEVVDLMAQGVNPDFDLPLDGDESLRERLQTMVGLLFVSPDFLWR